ncbi:aspartyl protease family protein [Tunturiibacter gelidiferens]|uniref:aspartyl protease family protein n=1 Tax=Tunturiibacter gelidiferens TaxID=3069689 RepID=UPI003D9B0187
MSFRPFFACVSFATLSLTVLAEPHCPGKVASLPVRIVQGSQIIVPLWVNQNGPYDFLVDTGAQITTVDSSLASELQLSVQGITGVGEPQRMADMISPISGSYGLARNPSRICLSLSRISPN